MKPPEISDEHRAQQERADARAAWCAANPERARVQALIEQHRDRVNEWTDEMEAEIQRQIAENPDDAELTLEAVFQHLVTGEPADPGVAQGPRKLHKLRDETSAVARGERKASPRPVRTPADDRKDGDPD